MNIALRYQDRIDPSLFMPKVDWRVPRNDRRVKTATQAAAASAYGVRRSAP